MKTTNRLSLAAALGSLIIISSAIAQTTPPPPGLDNDGNDNGLLGHPYLKVDGNLYQYRNVDFPTPTGFGAATKVNFGITDNFDFGMKYGFSHAKNVHWSCNDMQAGLYATGYYRFNSFVPYLSAGSGYGWEHSRLLVGTPEEGQRFHRGLYDVGTGVEIPVFSQASVNLGVDYQESFRNPNPTTWTYQSEINYNFDDLFGVGAGLDYQEGNKGNHNALVYHMGIRFIFD